MDSRTLAAGKVESEIGTFAVSVPVSITITISNEVTNARASLMIRDMNGKVIISELLLSENLKQGEHIFPLNIDQIPSGVYTVDVTLNTNTTSNKLIVID